MSEQRAPVRVAIETSTRVGSVAVGRGADVLAEVELGAQTRHASRALPALDEALRAAGVDRSGIEAVVVGAGPGSFTGVRVAGATAKGLATSLDVPLLAYSSLLALVTAPVVGGGASALPDTPVCGLFDARRGEVYAGCWSVGEGALTEVLAPRVGGVEAVVGALAEAVGPEAVGPGSVDPEAADPEAVDPEAVGPESVSLDSVGPESQAGAPGTARQIVFIGEGVERYATELEAACFEAGIDAELTGALLRPRAAALLWLADRYPSAGRVDDPAAWEPLYVRGSSAERGIRG